MIRKVKYSSTSIDSGKSIRQISYLLREVGADRFAVLQDIKKGLVDEGLRLLFPHLRPYRVVHKGLARPASSHFSLAPRDRLNGDCKCDC